MVRGKGHVKKDFAALLRRSIRQGLVGFFGRDTAVAVEFFLDSSIAEKDIAAYTDALEGMFGLGSSAIEERCAEALYSNLGLPFARRENYRLDDYVAAAREASAKG